MKLAQRTAKSAATSLATAAGAKGAAEVNICPPMAAIANAIDHAIGRRLTELPMWPPKVLAAIDAQKQA